jgi:hypothetical protein
MKLNKLFIAYGSFWKLIQFKIGVRNQQFSLCSISAIGKPGFEFSESGYGMLKVFVIIGFLDNSKGLDWIVRI